MFQRTIHVKCKDVLVEGTLKLKTENKSLMLKI